jgi:hypothetical protein
LAIPAGSRIHDPGFRKTLTGVGRARENSGTTEPVTVPVVPLFPRVARRRDHNSQKCGTGPGRRGGLSGGIGEVIFSRIWKVKVMAGCNGARPGFSRCRIYDLDQYRRLTTASVLNRPRVRPTTTSPAPPPARGPGGFPASGKNREGGCRPTPPPDSGSGLVPGSRSGGYSAGIFRRRGEFCTGFHCQGAGKIL